MVGHIKKSGKVIYLAEKKQSGIINHERPIYKGLKAEEEILLSASMVDTNEDFFRLINSEHTEWEE